MQLETLTSPELIFPELPGSDPPTVLRALAEVVVRAGAVSNADLLYEKLWEREQLCSTGIGDGIAIPHCKLPQLDQVVLAVGITAKGIDFGAEDKEPVRIFFLVVSPAGQPAAHLHCLAAISRWVKETPHLSRILALEDPSEIYRLLQEKR